MASFDLNKIRSKLNFDELYNNFLWLDKKQQYLVAGVLVVVLMLVMILPVNCVSSKLNEREKEYREVTKTATELYDRLAKFQGLRQGVNTVGGRSAKLGSDPLKRIIYQITDDVGIDRHKATLKTIPEIQKGVFVEEGKELTIRNIDFDQTIQLLEKLVNYSKVPVRVKKLTIKADRRNKQRMSSVVMTVTILKQNQET